jgi:MiaB-like tRNA modifying enzyme
MKSVYIETYGCSANQAHSEMMESSLVSNGFKVVGNIGKADVIVINTCIVKSPTENKIRERIKFLVSQYPDKKPVIAGCAADVGMFRKIAPNALFLSSHRSKDMAKLLLKRAKETDKKIRKNPLVNITEIAFGCVSNCSYCMVKLARGDLKSRSVKEIAREVENSIREGCKEIWITSQDCGCYGLDIQTNLAELLENIVKIKGEFKIRVGMMNPTHVKPILGGLIKIYKHPKVYKFIHIPVQSGSDRILRKMRRGYKTKDFERIVKEFRNTFSEVTFSTDVIVGFPGETERDFEKTIELIKKIKPDIVNVSKFGVRPGTEAKRMKQLDNKLVKKRSKKFADLVKKIGMEKNRERVSGECEILITERGKKKNQLMGRDEYYKPVIVESGNERMGKFLKVKITNFGSTHLNAEITRNSV